MEFSLDDVPGVVADRIRIATGEPQFLSIRRAQEWLIEALHHDRATVMRVEMQDDGSIREHICIFLVHTIDAIDASTDATVTVKTPAQTITVPVSDGFARLLVSARRSN